MPSLFLSKLLSFDLCLWRFFLFCKEKFALLAEHLPGNTGCCWLSFSPPLKRTIFSFLIISLHCKPKPCKAYRELPVSQFPQGKPCIHYREPLFSLQGPCFHYRDFPVNPCTSLLGIAVHENTSKFIG